MSELTKADNKKIIKSIKNTPNGVAAFKGSSPTQAVDVFNNFYHCPAICCGYAWGTLAV